MGGTPDRVSLFEGSFGFDTVLTQLFRQIDPVAELNRERHVDALVLKRLADAARRMSDLMVVRRLDQDVRTATRDVLFHERVHYWQLLSASGMQRQTMNSLAHLRAAVEAEGGKPIMVWAGVPGSAGAVQRDAVFLYSNFNWSGVSVFSKYERIEISGGPPTSLERVQFGLDLNTLIEGYIAELRFAPDDSTVTLVPLVGRFLVESAAHVSENLFKREDLPPIAGMATPDDVLYNGAWELWRRANAPRYEDPERLALSFLAAVDLAVSPELPLGPRREMQTITIPWRFGRILLAAPGIPALNAGGGSPAAAVADFQVQLCRALDWRTPTEVALEMAAYLTRLYAPVLSRKDNFEMIKAFHARPLGELGLDDLAPVLNLINQGGEPDLIGLRVMRSMINASIYRAFNPGKFALPHVYFEELSRMFPLPAILYEGDFYVDEVPDGTSLALQVDPIDYWSDCVRMMTIDHLRHTGEPQSCGFVLRNAECPYMAAGAGCPKRGLLPIEQMRRQQAGLDPDWCHWKLTAAGIGLVPQDENKQVAPPALWAARAGWFAASSKEDKEKMLGVLWKVWQEMSEEERRQALAGSEEMEKGLSEEERRNHVNVWAIIAGMSHTGGGT